MKPLLCIGERQFRKAQLWEYCIKNFELEKLWIIDSLPIFDPYVASRQEVARARKMLASICIARPFTFYQLRDKLFSLTKLHLNANSTLIVSGIDSFDEELKPSKEKLVIQLIMRRVIDNLDCKCILGLKHLHNVFGGEKWAEQCSQ